MQEVDSSIHIYTLHRQKWDLDVCWLDFNSHRIQNTCSLWAYISMIACIEKNVLGNNLTKGVNITPKTVELFPGHVYIGTQTLSGNRLDIFGL